MGAWLCGYSTKCFGALIFQSVIPNRAIINRDKAGIKKLQVGGYHAVRRLQRVCQHLPKSKEGRQHY